MGPKLKQIADNLWSGLWFIPGLLTTGGLTLGFLFSGLLGVQILPAAREMTFDPGNAVTVLTSLAGASITVVGVVFSITMVVLSSASSQLGPRLLSNFLRKTGTKLAIGGFVASFSYQLLVAAALAAGYEVPDGAVWFGLIGGLGSFGILLGYLHMVARFIQIPYVVDEVTRNLIDALKNFCEKGEQTNPIPFQTKDVFKDAKTHTAVSNSEGFIQNIDLEEIVKQAKKHDAAALLKRRAGDFVAKGEMLATLKGHGDLVKLEREVQLGYSLGPERTAMQDIEFALRQLIEIATKALSPGINDPETANTVIRRVGGALASVANCTLPSGLWHDDGGVMRVSLNTTDAAGLLDTAYNPLRQFGAGVENVAITLMESYLHLAERELHPNFAEALRHHIELLDEHVSSLNSWIPADLKDLRERKDLALKSLDASLTP